MVGADDTNDIVVRAGRRDHDDRADHPGTMTTTAADVVVRADGEYDSDVPIDDDDGTTTTTPATARAARPPPDGGDETSAAGGEDPPGGIVASPPRSSTSITTTTTTATAATTTERRGGSASVGGTKTTTKMTDDDDDDDDAEGGEADESAFGPFEDPIVDIRWNPFGGGGGGEGGVVVVPSSGSGSGEDGAPLFRIDDDDYDNDVPARMKDEVRGGTSSLDAEEDLTCLRGLFDSEYDRAIEDQEISWRARYGATRLSFVASVLLMLSYLGLGCAFYRSEAGWSVSDALFFAVYTVTTVGYGGPRPLPDTASFHAFTAVYVLAGISLVTVLAAHTWQLVTLEATRIRSSPWSGSSSRKRVGSGGGVARSSVDDESTTSQTAAGGGGGDIDRYRRQFMNELEDLVRERPVLDATLARIKACRLYLRSTRSGRAMSVALPVLGMIFLGAGVVGTIEGWSPLASIYWSIVTLTTVGYGDYVPTKRSSVWFCTLFFVPSSLFFLSFLLAHVAKSYIRLHAIHVTRLERWMRRDNERRRAKATRSDKSRLDADADATAIADAQDGGNGSIGRDSPGASPKAEDVERGFKTVFSYNVDEDSTKSSGLFGDQAGTIDDLNDNDPLSSENSPALRYRENVIRTKESAPNSRGNRPVTFAEAHRSLRRHSRASGGEGGQDASKPSLDVRLRVQSRLARIIAEEVAGYQTGVVIKGFTVSLTVGSLRDTADKWKIPPKAWKAFRAVAFRSLLFVGERELITDGGDALLRLNVIEFHQIFSPILAAFGDGSSMEAWLVATDILADVELRGGTKYGRAKPVFNGTLT